MSALDLQKERVSKRKNCIDSERRKKEEELPKIRNEDFKATRAIYKKSLASQPPPTFQESSESFEEGQNTKREILEDLQVATMGEGLKEKLCNL
jgi:hypothetical protein